MVEWKTKDDKNIVLKRKYTEEIKKNFKAKQAQKAKTKSKLIYTYIYVCV